MKEIRVFVLLITVVMLSSCSSDDNGLQEELVGKWAYSQDFIIQEEVGLVEMEIFNDYTFSQRAEIYGASQVQSEENVLKWQEYQGLLLENDGTLLFNIRKSAWFSIKEENPGPFTFTVDEFLYEGSVNYSLVDDVLTLNYISLANDAPVATSIRFVRDK